MSLLRKIRRSFDRVNHAQGKRTARKRDVRRTAARHRSMTLEALEPRVLLNADLYADMLHIGTPAPINFGDTLNVGAEVANLGSLAATPDFVISYHLSADNVYQDDTTDPVLHTETITTDLQPGSLEGINHSFTLTGTGDGDYYLLMRIDSADAVTESNETNNLLATPLYVGNITGKDLVAQGIGVPSGEPFDWGSAIDITADVRNIGDTDVTTAFDVNVHFSADNTYQDDTTDPVIATFNVASLAATTSSASGTLSVTLPGSGTDGENYLILRVDTGDTVTSEADETNNLGARPIEVGAMDLAAAGIAIQTTGPYSWGGNVAVQASVTNAAGVKSTDPVEVKIWLSADQAVGGDVALDTFTINVPMPGNTIDEVRNITLPTDQGANDYYVLLEVDSGAAVTESNETNNTADAAIQIGGIDLAPSNLALQTPGPYSWNDSLNVGFNMANLGGDDFTSTASIAFYFSTDTALNPAADPLLHTFNFNALNSGDNVPMNATFNLPTTGADGNYYILASVDNAGSVTELDETNNVVNVTLPIGQPTGVDLTLDGVFFMTPPPHNWNDTVDVDVKVWNAGAADAPNGFDVKTYLSDDQTYDSGVDTLLDTFTVATLAGDEIAQNSRTLTLPASGTDGDYWLIVRVDDGDAVASEADENNNQMIMPLRIGPVSGMDLAPGEVLLTSTGPFFWGADVGIDMDVSNFGDADVTTAFDTKLYLSQDQTVDGGDTLLDTINTASLAAMTSASNTVTVTLPTTGADGQYTIIMVVDDGNAVTGEADENNNTFMIPMTIAAAMPSDLAGEGVVITTAAPYVWGDPVDLDVTVKNWGDVAAGSFDVNVYVSSDPGFGPGDDLVGTDTITSLAAGASATSTIAVTLPNSGTYGQYYLIALIDEANAVTESNDGNNMLNAPIMIAPAATGIDLMAEGLSVTTSAPYNWGDTVDLDLKVRNIGQTDETAGFDVTLYFSQDHLLDGGDTLLDTVSIASLAALTTSSQTPSVTLPASGTYGQYYLIAAVDEAQAVTDADANNNVGMYMLTVGTPPVNAELVPDMFHINGPLNWNWGDTVNVQADVRNTGTVNAASFDVEIFLSEDDVYDNGVDTLLDTFTVNGVDAGSLASNSRDITLPASGTDGAYKLLMRIDGADAVLEVDDTNNFAVTGIEVGQVLASGIDLEPDHEPFLPFIPYQWGSSYTVAADLENRGDTDAGAFTVEILLSADDVIDTSDLLLGTVNLTDLAAGTQSVNDVNVTLPTAGATWRDGSYFVILSVDSGEEVTETEEFNNIHLQPIEIYETIETEQGTELMPIEFILDGGPKAMQWGQTAMIGLDVYNFGDTAAGAFDISVVLSTDPYYDTSDTEIGTASVTSLASLGISDNDISLTLPSSGTDGAYFLVAKIDSGAAVTEVDEANNTIAQGVHVGGPANGVDIVPMFFANPSPGALRWGGGAGFIVDLRNAGSADAGAFDVAVYLSTDMSLDVGDEPLGTVTINGLSAHGFMFEQVFATMPAEGAYNDGDFYAILDVDSGGAVTEAAEGNNRWAIPIEVETRAPDVDLTVGSLNLPSNFVMPLGQPIDVDNEVRNAGLDAAGAFTVKFYLSTDDTLDNADTVVGERNLSGLAANMPGFDMTPLTAPQDGITGQAYLIMSVDSEAAVAETDETNNTHVVEVTVGDPPPDLYVSNFQVMGGPLKAGGMMDVTNEVHNPTPNDAAGPIDVKIILSTDQTFDAADWVVGTRTIASLAPNAHHQEHTMITVPADVVPGDYFLATIVDSGNTVVESDENNNESWFPVNVEPQQIDLVISFLGVNMPGPFFWGDRVPMAADVRNDGMDPAGPFEVKLLLSEDNLPDANDTLLQQFTIDGIHGGGLSINNLELVLPDEGTLPDGFYQLIMEVDAGDVVEEYNEDNNSWFYGMEVMTPAPIPLDLSVPMMPPPPPGMPGPEMPWGRMFMCAADVFNESDAPIGNFNISVFFSVDAMVDASDLLMGSVDVPNVDPWMNFFQDMEFMLPEAGTFADGTYHIITSVDHHNVIDEVNEDNNVRVEAINFFTQQLTAGVDLSLDMFDLPLDAAAWGQTYDIPADVINKGDTDAGAFDVVIALSQDWQYDAADTELARVTVSALGAGEMAYNDLMVTLPAEGTLPDGPYHFIVAVDPGDAVPETDEMNNVMDRSVMIGQAGADLAVMEVMTPFDAGWGQTITVDARIENWGPLAVGPVDVAFYYSEDWQLDDTDALLTTEALNEVPGGGFVMATADITLPNGTGEGVANIIVVVDPANAIEEFDEEFNNTFTRDVFIGTAQLPNLMAWPMIVFDPAGGNVDWGDTITLDVMVDNPADIGTEAFTVGYYLSQDDMFSADDRSLGRSDVASATPFDHQSLLGVTLQLPASSPVAGNNDWFILAVADSQDAITEFDENDNTGWAPIFIGAMPADLDGWLEIQSDPGASMMWGESVNLSGEIFNHGGSAADNVEVNYYLSVDPEIDAADTLLATQNIASIPEESFVAVLPSVTLPADAPAGGSGTFFIIAQIDPNDTVAEIDEWNNFMGDWISPEVAQADLVAFHADPGWNAQWSDDLHQHQMHVHYELANFGNLDAGGFDVSFYLTGPDGNMANAYLLGSSHVDGLPADQEFFGDTDLLMPAAAEVPFVQPGQESGSFHFIMKVDSGDTVVEVVEFNNEFMMPIRIEKMNGMIEVTDSIRDPYDTMLDFGPVPMDEDITGTFQVANFGAGMLNLNDVVSQSGSFTVTGPAGMPFPMALAPQESVEFTVVFNSDMPGHQQGNIQILSDDPGRSVIDMNVWADVASAPVDIAVENVSVPAEAFWGDTVNIDFTVANRSAGSADQGVMVEVLLSDQPDGMGGVFPMLPGPIHVPMMAADDVWNGSAVIDLPEFSPFGYGGDLHLIVRAMPEGNSFDADWMNNENGAVINVITEAIGRPDLTFSWFGVPPEAAWGNIFDVGFGLRNNGMADAEAFTVSYYLSADDRPSADDMLLDEVEIPGLSAGAENFQNYTLTLPEEGDFDGVHSIIVKLDSGDVIDEEFEENNDGIGRLQIGTFAPMDLVAQSVACPPDLMVGEGFDINFEVANVSDEPVDGVRVEFFMADTIIAEPGFYGSYIGSTMVDHIDPGATFAGVSQGFLPHGFAEPGHQYVLTAYVDADQRYVEDDEGNNAVTAVQAFTADVGQIDIAASCGAVPAAASWGEPIELTVTVRNDGNAGAQPFFVDVVLSADENFDMSDFYLAGEVVPGLGPALQAAPDEGVGSGPIPPEPGEPMPGAPGDTFEMTLHVYLPWSLQSGDGDYYLLVKADADNVVFESDEANNTATSTAMTITGVPDLSVMIQELPQNVNFGQTVTVTDRVDNWGQSAVAEAFTVSYYLSLDGMFDPAQDILLGSRSIASLAAEANNTASTDLVLTQPEDFPTEGRLSFFAVVDADNTVAELFEGEMPPEELVQYNNVCWWEMEFISNGMPDLEPVSLACVDQTADWGQSVWVDYNLENMGTADAAPFTVTFHLSDNHSITAGDVVLGTIEIDGLASATDSEGFIELTLPDESPYGEDGEFYIGMRIDSEAAVPEINEENNKMITTDPLGIGSVVTVDLIAAFMDGPTALMPGETMTAYFELYNDGSTAAGAFDVDFYLTSAGVIDESAVLVGTRNIASLGAGAFAGQTANVTLPGDFVAEQPEYTLAMRVNAAAIADDTAAGVTAEKTYENNDLMAMYPTMIIEPATLDLSVAAVTTDADAAWGDDITVSYDLGSSEPIDEPIAVNVLLSRDGLIDGAIVLDQQMVQLTDLTQSGQVSVTLPDTSPFGRDGGFQVLVTVNQEGQLVENNMANNSAAAPLTVGSGMADLVAVEVAGVAKLAAGDSFEAYNLIENAGSEAAANFDVYFYLTADMDVATVTSGTPLGMRNVSALAAGGIDWTMTRLTVPNNVEDGDYHLAMVVDRYGDITESVETNNTLFAPTPVKVKTVTVDPDSYEPNNSIATAASVTLTAGAEGTTTTGSAAGTLHNNDDRDYFTFTTPTNANGFARVSVTPDDMLNAAVMVYNANGDLIGGADGDSTFGGEEVFTDFALSGGRSYTVLVKPMGDSFGAYDMQVELGLGTAGDPHEENNTFADAAYLGAADAQLTEMTIHTGTDVDYYQVTVPATGTGDFTVAAAPDPNLDAVLQVYDADENLIVSADAGGAGVGESLEVLGTVGASYTIRVAPWAGSTGGYHLDVAFEKAMVPDAYESNDDAATAYDLGAADVNIPDANIHVPTDIDYYALTVPVGFTQLEAYLVPGATLDGIMTLYEDDGTVLRSVTRGPEGATENMLIDGLTPGETLHLAVSGGSTLGGYGLDVRFGNAVVGDGSEPNNLQMTAYPIFLMDGDVTMEGLSIHSEADRDYFTFITVADLTDGTATVTLTAHSDTLDTSLRILNAAGDSLASTDMAGAGGNETVSVSGLTPGEFIFVDVNGWGTTGDYDLTFSAPLTAAAVTDADATATPAQSLWGQAADRPLLSGAAPEIVVVEGVGNANDNDLSFGAVGIDTDQTYTVNVLNTGAGDLEISSAAVSGGDSAAFTTEWADGSDAAAAYTIGAGDSKVLNVTFDPTALGLYGDATLTINSNDSDEAAYALALSGTGQVSSSKPDIDVVDSQSAALTTLTFADTMVDGTGAATMRITNLGAAQLSVTSAVISGTDADAFDVVQTNEANKSSDNYLIDAAGQRSIQVQFLPTTAGAHSATLTLTTNDPDEPTVVIPMTGNAVAPDLVVDLTPDDGTVANALTPTIDFGGQVDDGSGGQRGEYTVNFVNNGGTAVTISGISFGDNDSFFSIEGVDVNGFTIEAGQTIPAVIVFDPAFTDEGSLDDIIALGAEGTQSNTLTVRSNDLETPVMNFALSGQAVQAYTQTNLAGLELNYTDPDGDQIRVSFTGAGSASYVFDGASMDSANISSITVDGANATSNLVVTVVNAGGDGQADIGSVIVNGSFGSINVQGDLNNLDVNGALNSLTVTGVLDWADIDGALRTLAVGALGVPDTLASEVKAYSFGSVVVSNDVTEAFLTASDGTDNGRIGSVSIGGNLDSSAIQGASLSGLTVDGYVNATTVTLSGSGMAMMGRSEFKGNANQVVISAGFMLGLDVGGDLLNSMIGVGGQLGMLLDLDVAGDAEVDIMASGMVLGATAGRDFAGSINTGTKMLLGVTAGNDLSADITAGMVLRATAGRDVTSSSFQVTNNGRGMLLGLTAGRDINVTNLNVDGMIMNITAGKTDATGDIYGSITGDRVMTVRAADDIFASITGTSSVGTVEAGGSFMLTANVTCTNGNIDRVLVGDYIYGMFNANNGAGRIGSINYNANTFRNAQDQTDMPANHLNAIWTAPVV